MWVRTVTGCGLEETLDQKWVGYYSGSDGKGGLVTNTTEVTVSNHTSGSLGSRRRDRGRPLEQKGDGKWVTPLVPGSKSSEGTWVIVENRDTVQKKNRVRGLLRSQGPLESIEGKGTVKERGVERSSFGTSTRLSTVSLRYRCP